MIPFAALSGPLPRLGVLAVALLAGGAMLARDERSRAWSMLGCLVLAPILLLDDIWHSPQLDVIHRHPAEAAAGALLALALLAAAAVIIARRPRWLGPAAVIALPFRIPISAGGTTANLLVPLYVVVAAAALAWLVPVLTRPGRRPPVRAPVNPLRFEWLLTGFVVLYAVQALYSVDFAEGVQNVVFFYVPFALLLRLIRDLEWDRQLLTRCLVITVALAIVFALVGYVEYGTKSIFLNSNLVMENAIQPYFTVNSVFFDPNVFGRYLALVMILLVAVLLHDRRPRVLGGTLVALALLWVGLVLTLSRSSLVALLLGMAILAAARWRAKPVIALVTVLVVAGGIVAAAAPHTFGFNQGLNGASSGRADLVTGGLQMFGDRPLEGYGSGGFVTEYQRQHPGSASTVSASHTIAITVAAEQGVVGLIVYLALVIAALIALFRGVRDDPVRLAVAAAFLALVLHTELYADFLEDPLTWTLLGIGAALAEQARRRADVLARDKRRRRRARTAAANV